MNTVRPARLVLVRLARVWLVLVWLALPAAAHEPVTVTPVAPAAAPPSYDGARQRAGTGDGCSGESRIDERFDNGAAWTLCWSVGVREGLIVEGLAYTAPGSQPFAVLASGRLGQLHVAYDDNGIAYNDITQFGLGGLRATELTPEDCPDGELRHADDRPVLCLRRLSDSSAVDGAGDPVRQHLEVFAISQVGAYTYLLTWRLYDDGSIEPVIGASGALQRATDDPVLPFGRTLGDDEQTLWLSHTHNYYWRLDFDLGDNALDDVFTETRWQTGPDGQQARSTVRLEQEQALGIDRTGLQDWSIWEHDPSLIDGDTTTRGYRLDTSGAGHDFERLDVEAWSGDDLYVTVANDCERFASQNALYEPDCADDVAAFIDQQSLLDADLLLWQRISFHHVPRNEDRVHMHTHWDGFVLAPVVRVVNTNDTTNDMTSASATTDQASDSTRTGSGATTWLCLLLLGGLCHRRHRACIGFYRRVPGQSG